LHNGLDDEDVDDFVLACAKRLIGKGHDQEFAAYCERRFAQLSAKPKQSVRSGDEALPEALVELRLGLKAQ
jgi:hypothetical protein